MIADGSALDCVKILKPQKNGLWFVLEPGSKGIVVGGGGISELRCSFDQFLGPFLKQIRGHNSYRPLPPMLGNGQCVDLFKLFLLVKEKGGYRTVSENVLWNLVAEESGLDSGVGSALKLVYIKYLDLLDRWLDRIFKDKKSHGSLSVCGDTSGRLLMELETEFKGFLPEILDQKMKDEEYPHFDLAKSESSFSGVENLYCNDEVKSDVKVESEGGVKCVDDNDEVKSSVKLELDLNRKCVDDDEDVMILDLNEVNEEVFTRKRKREYMLGMLNWVTTIAKNPCDPSIGKLPERSKWKLTGPGELWKQVLLVREALFLQRDVDLSAEQSIWQKKQKMHPSMYEDHAGSERLRYSQRLLSGKRSRSRACSESSSSATQSDLDKSPSPCMEDHHDKQLLGICDPSIGHSVAGLCGDSHVRKRFPVGPAFQATIPEWTGVVSEIDSKWLGTRVWPLDKIEHKFLIERDPIGKGRQDSCGCQFPGSIACVQFHVAEKRIRIKLELGSAFQHWQFDKMGEVVGLSWSEEEKKRFKEIVRLNPPSIGVRFWDEIFKSFSTKSREDLVSYYFNVFLLQRRADQNRLTPNNIDSDDDESEFGPLSNGFGHEAINLPSSILYAQNNPHMNFR